MNNKRLYRFLALLLGGVIGMGFVAYQKKEGDMKTIQTHTSKDLVITLLSETGELKQGKNDFVLEFRSASTQQPVDVGRVTIASTMAMPGMSPMSAGVELAPVGGTGRYKVKAGFEMSGAWRFSIQWDGPTGKGGTSFNSHVR